MPGNIIKYTSPYVKYIYKNSARLRLYFISRSSLLNLFFKSKCQEPVVHQL